MAGSDAAYIASVVGTYWLVSISMVYLNKILMSNDGISIPAPLFVTWYQCVVTVLICWLAGICGQTARASEAGKYAPISNGESGQQPPKPSFFAQFPKAEYLGPQAKQIFPLSLVFGEFCINFLFLVGTSAYRVRGLSSSYSYHCTLTFLGLVGSFIYLTQQLNWAG